jgi:4-hydroxy-tetrahydrodipicolinate synthase
MQKNAVAPALPRGVWPTMVTPLRADGGLDERGIDALVDWLIGAGVAGLFTVCLSSEMYELDADERLALARRVVSRAAGRVPVVAAGAFGETAGAQAALAARLYDCGVAAVVFTVNQLAAVDEDDEVWQRRAEELFAACSDVPLGLYECPRPYHRTLPPKLFAWAAATGRVVFYKDTCCELPTIRAKVAHLPGTPVTWLNANAETLLPSLEAGGHGYCSIAANVIPATYVHLCGQNDYAAPAAARLQEVIDAAQPIIGTKYPRSAKVYLQRLGLPLTETCRVAVDKLTDPERAALDRLRAELQAPEETLDPSEGEADASAGAMSAAAGSRAHDD